MNLVNVNAETGADIVGDDSQPALTLKNTSTGPGLWAQGVAITSTASIDRINSPRIDSSTAGAGVLVTRTVVGSMSVGVLRVQGNSVASGAMIEFSNKGFISITSVVLTTVANTITQFQFRLDWKHDIFHCLKQPELSVPQP